MSKTELDSRLWRLCESLKIPTDEMSDQDINAEEAERYALTKVVGREAIDRLEDRALAQRSPRH